ncbi:MAG: FxsA family protein [Magnetococcales bacterium]|nr:FxsA family protein [Magnetococcales bacterium]
MPSVVSWLLIVELFGLLIVGQWLGIFWTLACLIGGIVAGILLIRAEGLRILLRLQERLASGQAVEQTLLEGLLAILGGILLIVPGFISDIGALLLIISPLRRRVGRWLTGRFGGGAGGYSPGGEDVVIEGECRKHPEDRDGGGLLQ